MANFDDLQQALADRDRLLDGWMPGASELASAPLLDNWMLLGEGNRRFAIGVCFDHPSLPRGVVSTSNKVAVDEQEQWVRTVDRWYRLGRAWGGIS